MLTPRCQPANPYDSHVYSRESAPNSTRIEAILTSILNGPTLSYASGLAAFHALLVYLNPKRIAIGGGYHGCHGVIRLMSKLTGLEMVDLDCADTELRAGDVVHVETPLNPTGEARNLALYAAKARRTGAYLTVDATFGKNKVGEYLHKLGDEGQIDATMEVKPAVDFFWRETPRVTP